MPTIDTAPYKAALNSGNRQSIIAEGRKIVRTLGHAVLLPDAPNVNATLGADNSAELKRYQDQFNTQALRFTDLVDGYNTSLAGGRTGEAEAAETKWQLQGIESSDANLVEIERINAGAGPGTGGGIDIPAGTPKWAHGLIRDVAAIKAHFGIS